MKVFVTFFTHKYQCLFLSKYLKSWSIAFLSGIKYTKLELYIFDMLFKCQSYHYNYNKLYFVSSTYTFTFINISTFTYI